MVERLILNPDVLGSNLGVLVLRDLPLRDCHIDAITHGNNFEYVKVMLKRIVKACPNSLAEILTCRLWLEDIKMFKIVDLYV